MIDEGERVRVTPGAGARPLAELGSVRAVADRVAELELEGEETRVPLEPAQEGALQPGDLVRLVEENGRRRVAVGLPGLLEELRPR